MKMKFLRKHKWAIITGIVMYADFRVGFGLWKDDQRRAFFADLSKRYNEDRTGDTVDTVDTVIH